MKNKFILTTFFALAIFFAGAQTPAPLAVTHQVHDLPVNIGVQHPTGVALLTVSTDTNGVLLSFPAGFIPIGLQWVDTNGVVYTYTKSDSSIFKPYPLFSTALTTADATGAKKFETAWNVLKVLAMDTSATGVQKIQFDAYVKQWYVQGFMKSALWTGKVNSANWRWFKATVMVTGYIANQDY